MIGLPRGQAARVMDEVFDFAELQEFREMPVRTYSSGMALRLGFATATHLDADLLLVDEALAVGDESFQQKCFDWLEERRIHQQTLALVSHDLSQVARVCRRCFWLSHGRLVRDGPAAEVLDAYRQAAVPLGARPRPGVGGRRALLRRAVTGGSANHAVQSCTEPVGRES